MRCGVVSSSSAYAIDPLDKTCAPFPLAQGNIFVTPLPAAACQSSVNQIACSGACYAVTDQNVAQYPVLRLCSGIPSTAAQAGDIWAGVAGSAGAPVRGTNTCSYGTPPLTANTIA